MPSPYLIAYDIGDPRRLARLHRYLKGEALALQYSVFFGTFTAAGIERLEAEIAARIDPRHDDVRIYPLPADFQVWALGVSAPLPEGIHFAPAERLLAREDGDAAAPQACHARHRPQALPSSRQDSLGGRGR